MERKKFFEGGVTKALCYIGVWREKDGTNDGKISCSVKSREREMTFCLYAVIACGMKEVLGMQRKRENGCLQTAVEACLDIDFGQDTAGGCGGDTWQKKKSRGS